jgi:hypothetical protein
MRTPIYATTTTHVSVGDKFHRLALVGNRRRVSQHEGGKTLGPNIIKVAAAVVVHGSPLSPRRCGNGRLLRMPQAPVRESVERL